MRSAFLRYPTRAECLRRAKTEYWIEGKTGLLRRVHYECAVCKRKFSIKQVAVDHIIGVGTTFTWDEYIANLFCGLDNLQVLCSYPNKEMEQYGNARSCHRVKTAKEAAERKEARARLSLKP